MSAVVVYNAPNLSAILIALIIILIFNDRFTLPCTDCTYYSNYMFVLHQKGKRCGDFPLGCDDWTVHMGCEWSLLLLIFACSITVHYSCMKS